MIHVDIGRCPLSQPSDERMEIELVDVAARSVARQDKQVASEHLLRLRIVE
jgi:hypothetical protein